MSNQNQSFHDVPDQHQHNPETKEIEERAVPCDVLTLPAWAPRLGTLLELDLSKCNLQELPPAIGDCTSLRKLDLGGNNLTTLPDSLEKCTQLEILFILGSRGLLEVPRVLGRMPSLTRLGLKSNGIRVVPVDSLPPNVEHLILTDNGIEALEEGVFSRLAKVRKLMLANNRLKTLPAAGVARMQSLELIRLANNDLSEVPMGLLDLPKLSWLALSGNPLSPPPLPPLVDTPIQPGDVVLSQGPDLGQGASGRVRAAAWKGAPVAVKEYTRSIGSDGRAEDELAIYAAVAHPCLVRVHGVLKDPPRLPLGLVMDRLPSTLHDLAKPPTIREVTVDRWTAGQTFPRAFVLHLLLAISRALRHLHGRGVAHGDVYGHNILTDGADQVRLVDFGAAYLYPPAGPAAPRLERVEVRAFGVLAGEMLLRVAAEAGEAGAGDGAGDGAAGDGGSVLGLLGALVDACMAPQVSTRPAFAAVVERLEQAEKALLPPTQ